MSCLIPVQLVDDDEFHALEVAIAAAEFSASSNKKPKTSISQAPPSSSSPPCNLQTDAAQSGRSSSFKNFKDLSSAQAPNKLEYLTEAPSAENRALRCTSLHGSQEKTCSRSLANIAADGAEDLQSDSRNVHSINRECGSRGGVSNDSSEEACLDCTQPLQIIQTSGTGSHERHAAGHACVNFCEGSNGVLLCSGNTDKLDPYTSDRGPLYKDTLRKCVSSRRLPAWTSSAGGYWNENSKSSGHAESRQTSRHRVDDELALNLDPPDSLCANNSRLPWGLVPHIYKVTPKCKLPSFQFKGRIKYSDTVSDTESAADELLRQVEAKKSANGGLVPLGFDTEWKVVFKRGAQRRKVAVLQLCIDAEKCNVFHIIHSGIPSSLKSILEDPMAHKVGVGAYGDAEKLRVDYNVKVKGVKDLSGLANRKMVACANKTWSLSSLAEELLGKQVDKAASIRMGDWEVEKLSEAQLQYAATDAFASLYLFQVLVTFPDPQ